MRRRFEVLVWLGWVLAALELNTRGAAAQGVVIAPEVALAAERLYQRAETEVVFCLRAAQGEAGEWRVSEVVLARQGTEGDSDGASFDCAGFQGFMHNHPRVGTRWCRLSSTDRATLSEGPFAFAVLWCPARRFSYEVRRWHR